MRSLLNLFWLVPALLGAVMAAAPAQDSNLDASAFSLSVPARHHTQATLLLFAETVKPGDTIMAAVHLKMDPHWHTYWRNPGESGMATTIDWQLPPGVTAGEIMWPTPEKAVAAGITTYDYNDETALVVPLTFAADLKPGPVEVRAHVSWLECAEICVPGSAEISGTLTVGEVTKPSADAPAVSAWQRQIATLVTEENAHWEGPANGPERVLIAEWVAGGITTADFWAYASTNYDVGVSPQFINGHSATNRLRIKISKSGGDWPTSITGLLVADRSAGGMNITESGITVFTIGEPPAGTPATASTNQPGVMTLTGSVTAHPAIPLSLWTMLLFAFVGGLILNVMPCVLPVIALKILGFVQQSKDSPGRVRKLGLTYTAGVVASFLFLAGLVIGIQAAGHSAGWGMQFRSPMFIVALTVLVTLVALNLFGVFEVTLNGGAMNAADKLAGRHGVAGAFFNGVLATALATPCTAPFLAPALGFAFAQPPAVIVLFFVTIALGLAAPYLILSCDPRWLTLLPKPGAWMEKFKIAMGFPMLGTAFWLYDVSTAFYGERSWWLGLFLVTLALAAWVFGTFIQRGGGRNGLAWVVVIALLLTGYAYGLEKNLRWRTAVSDLGDLPLKESAESIDWQKWTPQAVADARAAGRPVLVDFTAKWCLTCRVNKAVALEIPEVRAKIKALKVLSLLGDYTKFPDNITAELKKFDRAGVPLVLVYPADAAKPPEVLPAVLTPGTVLSALDKAK